jgi:hypothetical protein
LGFAGIIFSICAKAQKEKSNDMMSAIFFIGYLPNTISSGSEFLPVLLLLGK